MMQFISKLGLETPSKAGHHVAPVLGFTALSQAINLHKLLCFPVILSMIYWHNAERSFTAVLYLVMHGSYGLLWLVKHAAFPDGGFEVKLHPLLFLFAFVMGGIHWITSYLIIRDAASVEVPLVSIGLALFLYILGMFLHFVSEMQKYTFLKYRSKRVLMADGLFSRSRNINYLGEILIYVGFIILARGHVVAIGINAMFWLGLFVPNMLLKDRSLAAGYGTAFKAYQQRTGLLFPWAPTLMYFLTAFGITWGGVLAVMGWAGVLDSEQVPADQLPWVYMATLLGPATAGLCWTLVFDGWAGARGLWARLTHWRAAPRHYAVALLTAPVLITVTLLGLSVLLNSPVYRLAILTADDKGGLLGLGIGMGLVVALFEELGWTAFAIPRLRQRFSVLGTGLIMGVLWGLWHMPLFLGTIKAPDSLSRLGILCVLLFSFLPPFRIIMVWLYDQTGSLLVPLLMHAPLAAAQLLLIPPDLSNDQIVRFDLAFAAAVWILAFVLVRKTRA